MKQVFQLYKCILVLLILLGSMQLSAQVWKVDQLSSKIESGVEKINSKARVKNIDGALDELNALNTQLRFSLPEFPDWYKTAREESKDYRFEVNASLAAQFEVDYWRTMLQKVERNKKNLNEAFSGIDAMKTLDAQDVAWAYLTTIYNAGKAIKDVVESASTGKLGGVFFNTKEGMDQFIEDYKKIENAEFQVLETAQKEQELKLMISKAKAMERNYKRIEGKISNGLTSVESFNSNIESLYQLSDKLSKEAQYKIDWNDTRYNFYAQNYLERIEQEKNRLENSYISWGAFKSSFLTVGKKAVQEKNEVLAAIQKTDDAAVKQAKIDDVEAAYEAYSKVAFETFRTLEQQYAITHTEKINLNYQIDGFKPVPFPTGQNINTGTAGATIRLSAVQAEADVQQFINIVHTEVKGVNDLANRKQMETAVFRLNDLNRRFERELGFSFTENYRKAREDNPTFTVQIEAQLSERFKGAYWENSLKQNAAKLKDLRNRYYATPKSNAQRYWEITYALCKSAYDLAQLKPDVAEELEESGKKAAWDKFEEGTDGIKDDFKKIEKAFQMEYNTPENKAAIEALMNKVAITADALEAMASYMKVNEEEATRFYALVDRFNSIKREIESGPSKQITLDDERYNFNESSFYERAEQLVNDFKNESLSWAEFDAKLNQLNREAEQQKDEVIRNLKASDDLESKKQQAINTETNDWDYYNSWAIKEHGKCFELNKQTQIDMGTNAFAGAEETPTSNIVVANPFAGVELENNSPEQEIAKQNKAQPLNPENNSTPNAQSSSNNNFTHSRSYYKRLEGFDDLFGINKNEFLNRLHLAGGRYQNGEIDRTTFTEKNWQIILRDYHFQCDLFAGTFRTKEEVNKAKLAWQNFSGEMQQIVNSYLGGGQAATDVSDIQQQLTENFQTPTETTTNPSSKKVKNTLYHGVWKKVNSSSGYQIFIQKGNSVEIANTKKRGTIANGKLTYIPREGIIFRYVLLEDGYKMNITLERNGTLERNDIYEYDAIPYEGGPFDSDADGIQNKYDNCPNTPAGLTFKNGGVDIAGCPTGQGQATTNHVAGTNPTTETTSKTPNLLTGSGSQLKTTAPPSRNTSSSANPFAGAGSGGSSSAGSIISAQSEVNAQPQINSNNTIKTPPPAGYIGTASNLGNGKGSYCIYPVSELKSTDRIIFNVLSGDLKKTEIIWRTESGSWRTKYEGTQTTFNANDYLKDLPGFITHIIFTVNARHNSSYLPNACEVEVWHLPPGARIPTNWKKTNDGGSDKILEDFNQLVQKADEAFNKKYWNESQGTRASSNPKQESFDLLRRAEQLIAQQTNVETQYALVERLATKHAEYAKRVFANSAKVDFIEAAGRLLAQYGGKASSLGSSKSSAYSNIAKGWQELTKAAIWGDHQYNKMYCDKEAKRYLSLAIN